MALIEAAAAQLFPPQRISDATETLPLSQLQAGIRADLLWVIEIDKAVVGFALLHHLEDSLHLAEMDVHPDYGGRGLGGSLLRHIIDVGRARQAAAITLTTFADLPWNASFYRKHGFVELATAEQSEAIKLLLTQEAAAGLDQRIALRYGYET